MTIYKKFPTNPSNLNLDVIGVKSQLFTKLSALLNKHEHCATGRIPGREILGPEEMFPRDPGL
jgi:hypothetical protein